MPSCNDGGSFQTDKKYKDTFVYVAPGYCRNSVRQVEYIDETYGPNPCNSKQDKALYDKETGKYYKQKCMVDYQTSLSWVGSCNQGKKNSDCDKPEAFCNINEGQRAKDIMPLKKLMIQRNGDETDWNYKDKQITAETWNRVYKILQDMFNFPIPSQTNDTERRGVRTPYVYELVKCTRGKMESMYDSTKYTSGGPCAQPNYHKWIDDGKGWRDNLWRWSEVVPSKASIDKRITNCNGGLSLVYLVSCSSGNAEVPKFKNFTSTDPDVWESKVKDQKVYIRHTLLVDNNNNLIGVNPGDEVMFKMFNEILGIMDINTGQISQGAYITEALMQQIQTNIFNFEFEPDRCRYCNTNCNDGACQEQWQTDVQKCGEGGGCAALYGCLCYWQSKQITCGATGGNQTCLYASGQLFK